jgi:SAM-dependent methyltransferase
MNPTDLTPFDFDFEATFDVDDYMYFYSDLLTDEGTDHAVAALVEMLELSRSMRILDLACGFGRHANRLAARGHQVTGIDLTSGFLEIARRDALERGVSVDYQQGDMRKLDFVEVFDRVLLLFTAFGYFSDEENLDVLRRVARALKPAGMLAFDIQNRDVFLVGYKENMVTEKDGNLMIDRHFYDMASGRLYNRRIVIREGVRRDKPFFVRMYNPTEIRLVLLQAGLETYKMFGDWDLNPLSIESRRMIVIARKV